MDNHKHSDECWEPGSGCDMGRSAAHAVPARRKTDTRPATPVSMREALATGLLGITAGTTNDPETVIRTAVDKLRRDEQNNAEMVDVLVRAGYNDIPAQINASFIRRLLDYISPR